MSIELFGYEINQWIVAYVVMVIPAFVAFGLKIPIKGEMFLACLRATLQLLLMGLILIPIFNSNLLINAGIICVMILFGAFVARERGKKIKNAFFISLLSIFLGYSAVFAVFLLTRSVELIPRELVPISGMVIGNAARTSSLSFHRAFTDFEEHKMIVEAMLIDGAKLNRALFTPLHKTIKTAMVPQIDSLKTLGLVHIPGAMAGLVIAGMDPLEAAGYQILIFFGIISTSTICGIITSYLSYLSIFNSFFPHLKKQTSLSCSVLDRC